jgi:glucose-1-phosphate thymidylyltransferase
VRALVLAGGEGSRLRPLTHTSSKQLIPVANTPILFHALEAVREAGITEVGVVVGHTEDEIRAAVRDGSAWGLDVTYIPQAAPLGIAHAVMTAAEFVRGGSFLLYLGDNVLLEGVRRFVEGFERSEPEAQILLARVREPEHFGVAVLEGERVVRLVEKPSEFVSDVALVGVYLFRDSILDACATLEPSWRGEYEITEAIQWLIDHDRIVRAEMVSGWWKDTGRPEDLLEANRMLLGTLKRRVDGEVELSELVGAVVVEAGAKVVRSRVIGPAIVGAGTVLEDSTVGPDVSLSSGCIVTSSEISDSIAMDNCRVEGVRTLERSILGKDVEVRGSGRPGPRRLVVGDQSRLEV